MSIDANSFNQLVAFSHFMWVSLIQIGVGLYLLYLQVGFATFAGLSVMLLMVPLNTFLVKKMYQLQSKVMENKG